MTTHVGAYATLPDAYPAIFHQSVAAAPDLLGLPVIEALTTGRWSPSGR